MIILNSDMQVNLNKESARLMRLSRCHMSRSKIESSDCCCRAYHLGLLHGTLSGWTISDNEKIPFVT